MKSLLTSLLLLAAATTTLAQQRELSGTLLRKDATKSTEAYCAGGSEYFVLETKEETHILEINSSKLKKMVQAQIGQPVTVIGKEREKSIEPSDEGSHPVSPGGVFRCTVFTVDSFTEEEPNVSD